MSISKQVGVGSRLNMLITNKPFIGKVSLWDSISIMIFNAQPTVAIQKGLSTSNTRCALGYRWHIYPRYNGALIGLHVQKEMGTYGGFME